MRLDLFLKQSGLVKRRPVAKAMCDGGKIQRNEVVAKAADEVRPGDILIIRYGFKTTHVRVLDVPRGSINRDQRDDYFRIIREERDEEETRLDIGQENDEEAAGNSNEEEEE